MIFSKNISKEKAIEIAKKNQNMPLAIHRKIMVNFQSEGKAGILSFIELESPVVDEVTFGGIDYFQIIFLKGDISWQQLSNDFKEIEIFYDGEITDDLIAKCLINKRNGKFIYTGICNFGLEEYN